MVEECKIGMAVNIDEARCQHIAVGGNNPDARDNNVKFKINIIVKGKNAKRLTEAMNPGNPEPLNPDRQNVQFM